MYGLSRVKKKEGLIGICLDVLFDEFFAFLEKNKVNFFKIEVGSDHAASIVPGVGVFWQGIAVENAGRRYGNAVAIDVGIEPVSGGTTGGAEKLIEPAIDGAVRDGA